MAKFSWGFEPTLLIFSITWIVSNVLTSFCSLKQFNYFTNRQNHTKSEFFIFKAQIRISKDFPLQFYFIFSSIKYEISLSKLFSILDLDLRNNQAKMSLLYFILVSLLNYLKFPKVLFFRSETNKSTKNKVFKSNRQNFKNF
jgi:hypothetical protein